MSGEEEVAIQTTGDEQTTDETDILQIVCEYIAVCISALFILATFPLTLPLCIKVIHQYERGVKVRLGRNRSKELLKPGVVFVFPCVDALWLQDIRTKCYSTPNQQILTRDSVSMEINAALVVEIRSPYECIMVGQGTDIVNGMATRRALTSLRAICGNLTLTEIINGRERLAKEIKETMKRRWGKSVEVTRVEIKNICLPKDMERFMASEAISVRQAKAKVISADGEIRASRALKEAADIVATSPAALHLHYLHTLNMTSKKNNKTIVCPFPPDIMELLLDKLFTRSPSKTKILKVKPL